MVLKNSGLVNMGRYELKKRIYIKELGVRGMG